MGFGGKFAGCIAVPLALAGCVTGTSLIRQNALSADELTRTIVEVKQQVQMYRDYIGYVRMHPEEDRARVVAAQQGFVCGNGRGLDFEIIAVKFDLTVTSQSKIAGAGGAALPIGSPVPVGNFGVSVGGSHTVNDTQQLVFNAYPDPAEPSEVRPDIDNAPLAEALVNLRDALLKAATGPGACMAPYNIYDEAKDPGHTFKLALMVTDTTTAGATVGLSIINVSSSAENQSITGNAITVTFKAAQLVKKPPKGNKDKYFVIQPLQPAG